MYELLCSLYPAPRGDGVAAAPGHPARLAGGDRALQEWLVLGFEREPGTICKSQLHCPEKSKDNSLSSLTLTGNKTSLKFGSTYFPSRNHKKKSRFIRNNYLHLSCCLSVAGCSKSD